MTRKRRVIVGVAAIELMLAGLWFYLAVAGLRSPERVGAAFQQTLGGTMGAAMGAFLGFGVLMVFVAARNDRAAGDARRREG